MIAALAALWGSAFVHTFRIIVVAFVLGLAIGFERQWRQPTAGLRTNVLVAVGAAAFAELGMRLLGPEGATAEDSELDAAAALQRSSLVRSATWSVEATS